MDNLQESHDKIKLVLILLRERISFLLAKSRALYSVGFVSLGQDLDVTIRELEFIVEHLDKVDHLIVTHNVRN